MGQYWTLGIGEQFYLLWPIIVFFVPRERVLKIRLGACVVAIILRISMMTLPVDGEVIGDNTFTRMDALLVGAASACILQDCRWAVQLRQWAKCIW